MTAAYVGHRYWSFSHRSRPGLRQEYLRFVAINGATLLLGLGIVAFVRYLSDRRWVFPSHEDVADRDLARVASTPV